jgi:hypothetical protein
MILGKRDDFIGCVYRKRMSTKNSWHSFWFLL